MRLTKQVTFVGAFLVIAVCAYGQDVHYNYDQSANFATYKTYQWVEIPGGAVPDQLIEQAVKGEVEEQLAQKGLTKVENNADLYIGYEVVIKLETVSLAPYDPWWWGGWDTGPKQGLTSTVPVAMLLVDLYDVGKKQLIWRGDTVKPIALKKDPDKNYKNLKKVVTKLFRNYPPRRGKQNRGDARRGGRAPALPLCTSSSPAAKWCDGQRG